jgi:hypothetical protein
MAKKPIKRKKRRKPERDENQMAYDIVKHLARELRDPAAQELGRKGGIARKRNLSKEQLHEIAVKGANARWDKARAAYLASKGENQ